MVLDYSITCQLCPSHPHLQNPPPLLYHQTLIMDNSKPSRSKSKISIFRYASFGFRSAPFSPTGRNHHAVSIVPEAARRRYKNQETEEPTSPKVSCIGQIKLKKNSCSRRQPTAAAPPSAIQRLFRVKHRRSDVKPNQERVSMVAPPIGQMRRFASGREGLAGFDWRERVHADDADEEDDDAEQEDDDAEQEVIVPHSAPMVMGGGGAAKKEVNLWKRRMAAPPVAALQLIR